MTKTKRVSEAVKELQLENRKTYTAAELKAIAVKAKVDEIDVMCFLRYGRVF